MSKRIEIIVSPEGDTTVTTKGFVGSECKAASKFIEDSLGRATHEGLTGEFYGGVTHQSSAQARA